MPRIGIGVDSPDKKLELEVEPTSEDIIAELNKEGDDKSKHWLIERSAYNGIGTPGYWANQATENPPPLLLHDPCWTYKRGLKKWQAQSLILAPRVNP